jgi:predicted aspartyl protease
MDIKPFAGMPIRIALVCLAIGGACQLLQAESDLHFRLVNNTLIVVTLTSGQGGSFDFVLDTGTDTTVVDSSIASRLSFVPRDKVREVSFRGVTSVVRGAIPRLSAGLFRVDNVPVLVQDLANLRRLDARIHGIVGQNFLAHFNYLIDYRRQLVRIEWGKEIQDTIDGDHIAFESMENRMMVASEARSRGSAQLSLLLDSGSNSLILLPTASKKLGLPRQANVLEEVSGGQMEMKAGRVRALTVGSIQFHDISALLPAIDPGVQMGDGLLPTKLFYAVYVNNREGFVVFNPRIRKK